MVIVMLDAERRLKIYAEGGMAQERKVQGIGWVLADEEEFGVDQTRIDVIREASKYMFLPLLSCTENRKAILDVLIPDWVECPAN